MTPALAAQVVAGMDTLMLAARGELRGGNLAVSGCDSSDFLSGAAVRAVSVSLKFEVIFCHSNS